MFKFISNNLVKVAGLLAVAVVAAVPQTSSAQNNPGVGPANGSTGQIATIQRATGLLSNPVPYRQMSSVTGVGPIGGSVRVYNMFGVLALSSAFGGAFGGGAVQGGGALGGGGVAAQNSQGLVGSGIVPGIGSTAQGDDPPAGVLLHVNYANLYFSNINTINQNNGGVNANGANNNGGQGGFGQGGFGKGVFGNGGNGL